VSTAGADVVRRLRCTRYSTPKAIGLSHAPPPRPRDFRARAEARPASTSENGINLISCQPKFLHASAMLWRAKIRTKLGVHRIAQISVPSAKRERSTWRLLVACCLCPVCAPRPQRPHLRYDPPVCGFPGRCSHTRRSYLSLVHRSHRLDARRLDDSTSIRRCRLLAGQRPPAVRPV
jgi:hypothetical protein